MQLGASNASAPAGHLRATRKPPSAEERLKELGIRLPSPPQPFGTYAEAVRTGNLLFLSGMLPTEGHNAKFVGRVGAEFDVETGRRAARLAALNGLAVAREHPTVAESASDLLQDVFGENKNPSRLINGVTSLPLGVPVALELIFEVA